MAAVRQAYRLVDLAQDGRLDEETRHLLAQAAVNPTRMVDLVVFLAEMVGTVKAPPNPNDETYQKYLKRAHAAYTKGVRGEWAVDGEREYQRLRKQRERDRAKETAA
jgi:hypothetical protein